MMKTLHVVGLLTLLGIVAGVGSAQEKQPREGDEKYVYKYVVKGHFQQDRTDRELSLRYDTEGEAMTELKDKERTYYDRNGLLYASTDKPLNMRVVTLRIPKDSPSDAQEVPPEAPTPGQGKKIEIRKPKFVDTGSAKKAGESAADIAYGFAAGGERESQRVVADYQQYLRRSASASEIQYWVNVFENGGSNEQVIAGFVSSQEYFQDHGNNIVDWLFVDYRATLQRQPDTGGYQYWLTQLE
jgi:hypothetical protein